MFPPHLPKVDAMRARGLGGLDLERWARILAPAHFLRQLTLRELVHLSLDCNGQAMVSALENIHTRCQDVFMKSQSLPYL